MGNKSTNGQSTTAVVTRSYFEGKTPLGSDTKNEEIEVRTFVSEPAKVSVAKGLTLNLGNFESARIEISVTVPCYPEELDNAYKFADNWVEKRLDHERSSIRQHKPGNF